MRYNKELTLKNIADAKLKVFDFDGEWYDAFGKPEKRGIWFIYGGSGHGKTSFLLMLIKKIAKYEKILFLSYEEGEVSKSLQNGINRLGLLEVNNRVLVTTKSGKELTERLKKTKSPDVVIIDSLDISEFKNIQQVDKLKKTFENKLFIFTGWTKGNTPAKRVGEDVLFLANQKIYVEGYRAISRGRSFGTKGYLTIWDEGARKYWEYK